MLIPTRYIILILAVLSTSLTKSQSSDSLRPRRFVITTSLIDYFPTFNLNTGNFNIGAEIYVRNNKSFSVNAGLIRSYGPSSGLLSITSIKTNGWSIQLEGRHYFNKRKIVQPAILLFWPHIFQYHTKDLNNTGYYISVHTGYQSTVTEREETAVDFVDSNPFPNTTHYKKNIYQVNRSAIRLNCLIGYQCIKRHGLTVDYSVGLGGQFISSFSSNRLGQDINWPNSEREIISNKLFDHGTAISPSFVYRVRLGWAF